MARQSSPHDTRSQRFRASRMAWRRRARQWRIGPGESVVVDLVGAVAGRTQDAGLPPESCARSGRERLGPQNLAELGEVVRPVRDLRPGRRHEVTEGPRRDVLLRLRKLPSMVASRWVRTIRSAPPRRSSVSRRSDPASRRALLRPEPARARAGGRAPRSAPRRRRLPGRDGAGAVRRRATFPASHLVEHRFDERRLDRHLLAGRRHRPVPLLERTLDRLRGQPPVEVVEPQVVAEQPGIAALEAVEPGERVLADRDQEVRGRRRRSQRARSSSQNEPSPSSSAVVEEVLLELVEDDEHQADAGSPARRRGDVPAGRAARARAPARPARPPRGSPAQRPTAVVAAHAERDDDDRGLPAGEVRARQRVACGRRPRAGAELFPTPLAPYRSVSREARRLATTIAFTLAAEEESASCSS